MITLNYMSELQVLSFIFRPLCKFCPLCLNLTSFVLYVYKSSTFYPFGQNVLDFLNIKDKTCLIFKHKGQNVLDF
ncbi:hypothetical protein Hanom_Chr04g00289851 [Helianthus anomalus]